MNIENIKSQFPIFSKKVNGKPLVYLDSSNSSQKPLSVINRLDSFYKNEFSNIGRSIHSLSVSATNKFDETRESVKKFINANSKEEIIFTKNATESINLAIKFFSSFFYVSSKTRSNCRPGRWEAPRSISFDETT